MSRYVIYYPQDTSGYLIRKNWRAWNYGYGTQRHHLCTLFLSVFCEWHETHCVEMIYRIMFLDKSPKAILDETVLKSMLWYCVEIFGIILCLFHLFFFFLFCDANKKVSSVSEPVTMFCSLVFFFFWFVDFQKKIKKIKHTHTRTKGTKTTTTKRIVLLELCLYSCGLGRAKFSRLIFLGWWTGFYILRFADFIWLYISVFVGSVFRCLL